MKLISEEFLQGFNDLISMIRVFGHVSIIMFAFNVQHKLILRAEHLLCDTSQLREGYFGHELIFARIVYIFS